MTAGRLAIAALLVLTACDPDGPCDQYETLVLRGSGSCLPTLQPVEVQVDGCSLTVRVAAGTLPARGGLDQSGDPVRQGGWQIYGPTCPVERPACTDGRVFRRCLAARHGARLDLTCIDGAGAPACEVQLTE
jgi:hypothetical protein